MKLARLLILSTIVVLMSSGCFMGTFQTAQTLGYQNTSAGWYFNFPIYFDRQYLDSSVVRNKGGHIIPTVGYIYSYGVAENIDAGFRANFGEGIGVYTKIQYLNVGNTFRGALLLGLGFQPLALGMTLRSDLIFSTSAPGNSTTYFGFSFMRMPDYRRIGIIFQDAKLLKYDDLMRFKLFMEAFGGVELTNVFINHIPVKLAVEFGVPIQPYPPIYIGVLVRS